MKLTFKHTLSAFLLVLTLGSCKKSNSTDTTPTVASGKFTYKADGVASVADSAYAVLYGPKASRAMDIYSSTGKKEGMEFHFSPKTGAQTVGSLTGGNGILLTYYDANGIEYDSQSGTFNLSACDTLNKNIVGDFAFSGKMQAPGTGTKSITEGHIIVTKILHQ
jgi:hypothetical protein